MRQTPTLADQCRSAIAADRSNEANKAGTIAAFGEAAYDADCDRVAEEMNRLIDTPPQNARDLVALCDLIEHSGVAGDLAAFVRNVRVFALAAGGAEPPEF